MLSHFGVETVGESTSSANLGAGFHRQNQFEMSGRLRRDDALLMEWLLRSVRVCRFVYLSSMIVEWSNSNHFLPTVLKHESLSSQDEPVLNVKDGFDQMVFDGFLIDLTLIKNEKQCELRE